MPNDLSSVWTRLDATRPSGERRITDLFDADPNRVQEFTTRADGLIFDYSKTNIDKTSRDALLDLAVHVAEKRDAMFAGARINETEDRSVLHTALRNYAGGVHIRIVGLAASAASIIAMAGESEMTPTGMMMIHNVQTEADGDYRQMEHTAGILRDANHAIISAYIAKTGRPEAEIAAMMDAETWITAERAVELGLVDRVMQPDTGQKPMAADFYSGMLSEDALRRAENFLKGQAAEPDFFMPERAQAEAKLKFLKLKGELK